MSKRYSGHSPEVVAQMKMKASDSLKKAWAEGKFSTRKNGVYNKGVSQKISESIKKKWEEGYYKERINGMTGLKGSQTPNWAWGKGSYKEILSQFEEEKCILCGKNPEETKIDTHHVDENHSNYLLSNLQFVCVPCHGFRYHYNCDGHNYRKTPFVTIGKIFDFEYSHILPWHPGKCSSLHGHSGLLKVEITARVNDYGIVEDFYNVSQAVKTAIIEEFDHKFLNDFMDNPTSENILIFIWKQLELYGLKGLSRIEFSETRSSYSFITKESMYEAFGWDKIEDKWILVEKEEALNE